MRLTCIGLEYSGLTTSQDSLSHCARLLGQWSTLRLAPEAFGPALLSNGVGERHPDMHALRCRAGQVSVAQPLSPDDLAGAHEQQPQHDERQRGIPGRRDYQGHLRRIGDLAGEAATERRVARLG